MICFRYVGARPFLTILTPPGEFSPLPRSIVAWFAVCWSLFLVAALVVGALLIALYKERYGKLYQRMVEILGKLDPDELDRRPERRAAIDELPAGTKASMWVDIDATIADTNTTNHDQHVSVEKAIDLHVERIETWIRTLEDKNAAQFYWLNGS